MNQMIAIRVSSKEKELIRKVSELNNCGMSSWIKKIILEKLEDEYDLKIVKEYEKRKREKMIKLKPIEELFEKYGV